MMNYDDAIKYITSNSNFYIDLGLDRISKVLDILGNPQDKMKFIHVAGTNGKGSVCSITASILAEAGYKVGLYSSPHIWEYTERIKINGIEISKSDFAKYVEKISKIEVHLTEFEILTVMMFLYFSDKNVEIAVLETGMGGRLDATNVIKENLCSIITQIDLDHTDRLGTTKDEIAYEKAGIIKKGCPLVTSMGFEPIRDKVDEMDSMMIFTNPYVEPKFLEALTLKGFHQAENLALVIAMINYVFKDISDETIISGLKKVYNPCRFQYIQEKNLIIDASHNPNGINALRQNLDYYFPSEKRRFIFGALKTKDYEKMMSILFRDGDEIYLNEFAYPNSCSYNELSEKCLLPANKFQDISVIKNDKLNIICGSFYMIGGIKWLKSLQV